MRRTTLWKLGGAVCNQPEVLDALARRHGRSRPNWIVMHGAGPQLDAALREVDGPPRKLAGLRITSPAGADVVVQVMDAVGKELTRLLCERGVPAVHVPASSAWLSGVPKTVRDGDLGRVGTPTGVDVALVQELLSQRKVPVLSPVAWDQQGPLNINADEAAAATASHLRCHGLQLVTDVPCVRRGDEPLSHLTTEGARALIGDGHAEGGMIPKLESACAALAGHVRQVHIGDVLTILAGGGTRLTPALEVPASK